ncbi:MAG: tetratricopeptide repeat protein [Anaerolineales bacterium]|nr:tetratricopeptide repeat protein [Anaerolineales bacterium]
MAKIPLKAYHREIEELIERGEYDQAIAHCKHILEMYPKSIDTYRLLGKSYLESQRFVDASDIFQRLLSAAPDDFVSHVGMSIIREDEGNLDDSIWHMERAFEVQPANAAIQGELRRLCGRRNGIEPPKINLTRGALARMYIKGGLYQQAIAELRIALGEDAQRPDLQVLLARAYALANQKVESVEICNSLIAKYPYCLEANRLLSELLVHTDREVEVETFKMRYRALYPYAAFVTESTPTPEQVPDAAVNVEKLEWRPGRRFAEQASQPEWASSLGVQIEGEKPEGEGLPDWLVPPEEAPSATTEVDGFPAGATPEPGAPPKLSDEWSAAVEVEPPSEPSPGEAQLTAEATPGELPEWMKDAGWKPAQDEAEAIPPTETSPFEEPLGEGLAPAEIPEWIRSLAPDETPQEEAPPIPGAPGEASKEDSLSWLEEAPPSPGDSMVTWLQDLETEPPAGAPAGVTVPPADQELPAAPEEQLAASELPDWLKNLEELAPAAEPEQPSVESVMPTQEEVGPQPILEMPSEIAESGIPDWLKDTIQTPEPGAQTQEMSAAEPPAAAPSEAETQPVFVSRVAQTTPSSETDIRESLQSLDREAAGAAPPPTAQATVETPAFEPAVEAEAQPSAGAPEGAPLSEEETNAAFAWLENLAAKQGAEEALLLQPEERLKEPPEWVKHAAGEIEPPASEAPAPQAEASAETLSEPLEPFSPTEPEEPLAAEALAADFTAPEIPPAGSGLTEWLRELQGSELPPETPAEGEEAEEPLLPETELPEWITSPEPEPTAETAAPEPEIAAEEAAAGIEVAPAPEVEAPFEPAPPEGQLEPPQAAEVEMAASTQAPSDEFAEQLALAHQNLQAGKPGEAYPIYDGLIRSRARLGDVIAELTQVLYQYPMDVQLWQSLGDAYMRSQQLNEALEAYTKAEELLR